ncbi:expressed unknown protein [Seminavis robusta]|uniref:Uncharacterized protein n=1 Tax=Seminavis robusta TaxID=568900 RepID=A0A9N8HQ69_9STRA|nr:expressed unknown protein [Seminavis robusta]|eukprot:Sro1256_g256580.1 n/a (397) ;mRNA; f:2908-4098
MEKGDKAFVVGLQNRQDLNGTTVNLLEWNQATGRWSARVASGRREGICIKPINLSAVPPLDPVMVSAISASVRGGDKIMSQFTEIGIIPGQVSYELFMTFTSLMVKAYGNTMTEAKATEMLIEHIGKFGDARLVCGKLKKIASDANDMTRFGIVIPTLSAMLRMDTGKGYLELMIRLREGTIAHIRSQQAHLRRFKSQVQEIRVQSDDPFQAAMKRMCGREGSKSMSPKHIAEELAWAGMTGDMTIIGEEGVEKVKFDMILHRAYVKWLVQDVLPTLDPRDAKDGTLGKWHQVLHWESQLTGSVFVTHDRVFLDISDDFRIDPWIDGLVKFDLKTLESMPGVDADKATHAGQKPKLGRDGTGKRVFGCKKFNHAGQQSNLTLQLTGEVIYRITHEP